MKKIIFSISTILISLTALAQETLTLQQCRDLALENNKEIKAAHEQTKGAEYTVKSYKALYKPNIKLGATGLYSTAGGSFSYDLTGIGNAVNSVMGNVANTIQGLALIIGSEHPQYYEAIMNQLGAGASPLELPNEIKIDYKVGPVAIANITLEQPIYMGGKIKAANKMAQSGLQMAQTNNTLVKQNVIVEVDNAYALCVKANEMLKVALRYNEVLQELMNNVQSAYKNGLKPKNDVLKVIVKLNESELNIRKAENAKRLASMNLCRIIGKPLMSPIAVSSEFPSVEDIEVNNTTDISMRPEYKILEQQVNIAEQQVNLDKSASRPEVGLMAMGGYTYGGELNDTRLLDDFSGTVLVNVSIPLFHFGENSNKIRAAKAKLEQARYERESKNELMQLQLTQAANNLEEAKLEAELADKNLEQAAENMRLSLKNYQAEMEPLSDYLEAQTLWQQAYEQQVDAYFKLYLSKVEYKKVSGVL
ncbi:MAG: TolC family protein [Bacteroidia bacterium]|nr:TolC family protein [Bacteroidia bacterium]